MEVEDYQVYKRHTKKIRVKIITNRNLQFITSVKPEATISQLANRALSVYLELTGQKLLQSTCKKQLTVSAVKQGVFYMPKSQCVSNILNQDEVVEVIIVKAKPKFPNTAYSNQLQALKKEATSDKKILHQINADKRQAVIQQEQEQQLQKPQLRMIEPEQTVAKKTQLSLSKKLKKKQKKKQKNEKKKKILEEKEAESKQNTLNDQVKNSKERQILPQSLSKKKVKLQKEQFQSSSQKPSQIVIPSPKITFHADPKLDSPRNFILGQAQKKKTNFEPINKGQDQQSLKKTPLQKILSPHYTLRSPFMLQKTPINTAFVIQSSGKQKEKQQLLNFTLPRKVSEDKKFEPRKDKVDENINDFRMKKQATLDKKENNSGEIPQAFLQKKQVKLVQNIIDQEKTAQKNTPAKPKKIQLIIQPQSDSQSEQKKNIDESIHLNHRFKQFAQINSKIQNFLIQSEEEC